MHVTQKTGKDSIVTSMRRPRGWVKCRIFSSLERYGTSETNLPKRFTVVEGVMRNSITSNS